MVQFFHVLSHEENGPVFVELAVNMFGDSGYWDVLCQFHSCRLRDFGRLGGLLLSRVTGVITAIVPRSCGNNIFGYWLTRNHCTRDFIQMKHELS